MKTQTSRQRMLSAYRGLPVDTIPVAPEFWYYIPARVLGVPMVELELEVPLWQALQATFNHYQCEGWGIVSPVPPDGWGFQETNSLHKLSDNQYEKTTLISGTKTLSSRTRYDLVDPSWQTERFIKDFHQDWPIYEYQTLVPPDSLNWKPVQEALQEVGEDYLLEVFIGFPFIDFAGNQRQGGYAQVIQDLIDFPEEMKALQQRYISYMGELTRAVFRHTPAASIFIGSIWSSISLLSPSLWRAWDQPVLETVVQASHEANGLVHHHFHGKCHKVLADLSKLGLDCICPFERPPGGDITNLVEVHHSLGAKTAFNGNVSTIEALLNGTPESIRAQVNEVLLAFDGSNRLIVGTGDQVAGGTPDDNIYTMIETVRNFKTSSAQNNLEFEK